MGEIGWRERGEGNGEERYGDIVLREGIASQRGVSSLLLSTIYDLWLFEKAIKLPTL